MRWDLPIEGNGRGGGDGVPATGAGGVEVGGGGTLYNDPQNNHPYYYNSLTNESVWAEDFDASRKQSLNVGTLPRAGTGNGFFEQEAEWTMNDKFERMLNTPEGQEALQEEVRNLEGEVERGEKKVRIKETLWEDIMDRVPTGVKQRFDGWVGVAGEGGGGGEEGDDADDDSSSSSSSDLDSDSGEGRRSEGRNERSDDRILHSTITGRSATTTTCQLSLFKKEPIGRRFAPRYRYAPPVYCIAQQLTTFCSLQTPTPIQTMN